LRRHPAPRIPFGEGLPQFFDIFSRQNGTDIDVAGDPGRAVRHCGIVADNYEFESAIDQPR
jgi:hypothetical protein